jgi:lipopolysaccharide transport protein LptA
VTTRVPREAEGAILAETDFLQIAADDLEYDGRTRRAVYRGHVRVTLLEGWLEADRIEVQLSEDEGGIHEIWAYDNVRIEFRDPEERDVPQLVSGTADRVSYVPGEQTVRLFGDEKPASVRRLGTQGATTTGRVLRYQLDVGTLEVESGEQAPASIRGS